VSEAERLRRARQPVATRRRLSAAGARALARYEEAPRSVIRGGGHVLPFPPMCTWCGEPALADSICPSTVACPRCDARPGERCRLPNGHATRLHRERRALAAG
jgi:hypothetical protein